MALKFPISNSKNLNVKEALRLTHDIQLDSTENQTFIHYFNLVHVKLCVCVPGMMIIHFLAME